VTTDRLALEEELLELAASCEKDPLRFVRMFFPWGEEGELKDFDGPDRWQVNILTAVRDGLLTLQEAIQIAVASGHGIGKSALVAWLILWAMSTKADTKGVVTANTEVQLKTKTWAELAKWKRLLLCSHWFDMTATSIFSVDPAHEKTWRVDMIPWNETRPEAFAGLHNKGRRILLIFDEASAIHDVIWEVAEGAMTDENTEILWFAFGNPTLNTGRFRECFGRFKHRWTTRQIDSRSCKMTNKEQIKKWEEDWGEDSDFFRVRVRGEFPRAGSNQFIPSDTVHKARKRTTLPTEGVPKILAVDVARFGTNRTVPALRQGRYMRALAKWRGLSTDQTTERVIKLIEEHKPDAVVIDEDGIGGAVVDQLRARDYDRRFGRNILYGFRGGMPANDDRQYFNRRSEVWDKLRKFLADEADIDDDPEVEAELTGPEYGLDKHGRFMLEKKEDMEKRGLESPDIGDAYAMTFAVSVNPIGQPVVKHIPKVPFKKQRTGGRLG
jgi:hypothetical protein